MRALVTAAVFLSAVLAGCAGSAAPTDEAAPDVVTPGDPQPRGGPDYVTRGAERVDAAAYGIGEPVPAAAYTNLHDGTAGTLKSLCAGSRGLVVVFSTLGCPVCKLYHPRLEALAQRCSADGVRFLVVDPAIQDSPEKLAAKAKRMGWTFPLTRDPDYALTDALRAERTTDVFLLDADGVLRYRGALDDQYGIGYRLAAPRERYLEDALVALGAGTPIEVPATRAPGCKLSRVKRPAR